MISQIVIEQVLARALSTGGDFAEVFVENTTENNLKLVDGSVNSAISNRIYGVGIRIFKGLKSVYSCTNDFCLSSLLAAADAAAAAIDNIKNYDTKTIHLCEKSIVNAHNIIYVPSSIGLESKIEILKTAYKAMKDYSKEIVQGLTAMSDSDQNVIIANSEGLFVKDRRIRTRLMVRAVASNGKENQTGVQSPGKMAGYEFFKTQIDPEYFAKKAAVQAVTMLHADYIKAGKMPVAIENGFGGVIFHEACGHSLESESVAKGLSEFAGKIGKKVANEKVTAIDDGTIENGWGSINVDDEGTKSQKNILIENGILKGYMIDKMGSRRMDMPETGSGRRQGYMMAPVSRMTNTYIAPGQDNDEDIIKSIDNGLYAKSMGGGQVNPTTGEFNFSVQEGYLIKNGQIDKPVRGASLIGKGSEVLMNIDMVGSNLLLAQGVCGAASGAVPTNVGQPLIRVNQITVGGR